MTYRYRPVIAEEARYVEEICSRIERGLDNGVMPVEPFQDDIIFRAEIERVYTRNWVFVTHESEIPNPGDFVLRKLGLDQVIVTRNSAGTVNVLLNQCRHRGAPVCLESAGKTTRFRCPYHGWVYKNDGDFVGAPDMKAAYGGRLDSKEWGLLKARVEISHGLIFACLSHDAPSLGEYLGDARWVLDAMFALHPKGLRVLAPPERFIVRADWKSGFENFSGDSYHVGTAHYSTTLAKLVPGDMRDNTDKAHGFLFPNGHSFVGHTLPDWFGPQFAFWGYPPEMRAQLDLSRLDEQQISMLTTLPITIGNIFPNFSFLRFPSPSSPGAYPMAYTDLRLWQPLEPGVMEIWHWILEYDFMPEDFQRESYVAGQLSFGAGGMIEQDDTVLWEGAARAAASPWARKERVRFHYGQRRIAPDPAWRGPGQHFTTTYGEYMQDAFWRRWLQDMREGEERGVGE